MVDVRVISKGTDCLITIDGEVDASSSIHLDEAMHQAVEMNTKRILVDCKNLRYISSAGLGVFMSYIEELENRKTQLILFRMHEKVYKVFEILGLHQLLTIVDNEEEAKI